MWSLGHSQSAVPRSLHPLGLYPVTGPRPEPIATPRPSRPPAPPAAGEILVRCGGGEEGKRRSPATAGDATTVLPPTASTATPRAHGRRGDARCVHLEEKEVDGRAHSRPGTRARRGGKAQSCQPGPHVTSRRLGSPGPPRTTPPARRRPQNQVDDSRNEPERALPQSQASRSGPSSPLHTPPRPRACPLGLRVAKTRTLNPQLQLLPNPPPAETPSLASTAPGRAPV